MRRPSHPRPRHGRRGSSPSVVLACVANGRSRLGRGAIACLVLAACGGREPAPLGPASSSSASSTGGAAGAGGAGGAASDGGSGTGGDPFAIDECTTGKAACAAEADCIDTPGFYECVCKSGYEGDGATCTDVDECAALLDDCDGHAVCTNAPGSFSCACPPGFLGDGQSCSAQYERVAVGTNHACALRADKTLWCWGLNSSGQVGTGTSDVYFHRPVAAAAGANWKHLALGGAYSCAIGEDDQVRCWGLNTAGQLGDGTLQNKTSPSVAAGGTSDWATVEGGTSHTCGIRLDGTAHCWGRNVNGQVGDGTKDNNNDGIADLEPLPVPVAGGGAWLTISAGVDYSCGIMADHTLWCWGLNTSRQLGDGTTTERVTPVQEKSLATNWATVDAGNAFTCATKQDKTRHCWGTNDRGQGGDGTQASITEPKQVDSTTSWSELKTGFDGSGCGLFDDGTLWCWGDGTVGQTAQAGPGALSLVPVQVGAASDYTSFGVGHRFACAVRSIGALVCWGSGTRGELASGYTSDRVSPTLAGGATDWQSVDVSNDWGCGLRAGGGLHCWGRNHQSSLGDASNLTRVDPVPVGAGLAFSQVTTGRNFGCGIAGGDAYCWGRDDSGALGNGSGTHTTEPVLTAATSDASPFTDVRAGSLGACGLKADATLWCWGADGQGQVGDGGSNVTQQSPVRVLPNESADWTLVRQNGETVCGLRTGGTLWCWGRNLEGQVGNGTTQAQSSPVQIGTASYLALDVGQGHACAVATSGALYCWGLNTSGQLGQGNTQSPVTTPKQVGLDLDWESPFLGLAPHTCATKTSGALYCWGAGYYGQLGLGNYTQVTTPQKVTSATPFAMASLGTEHTCAVDDQGHLLCWGASHGAQLGGGTPFLSTPTEILDPL